MHAEWPVILIGGVPRIGKTRLACKIAELTEFNIVRCDEFRENFWSTADEQERATQRYRWYEEVIARRGTGLIIEGDDLIFRNRGNPVLVRQGLISDDQQLTLDLMIQLQARTDARAFVAGCAGADLEKFGSAIRHHETKFHFTRALSDGDLKGFVHTLIQRSETLRMMAAKEHITYLEMGQGEDTAVEQAAFRTLNETLQTIPPDGVILGKSRDANLGKGAARR